jgi:hypothetical protein
LKEKESFPGFPCSVTHNKTKDQTSDSCTAFKGTVAPVWVWLEEEQLEIKTDWG